MHNWTEKRLSVEFNRRLQALSDDPAPSLGGNVYFNGNAFYDQYTLGEDVSINTLCYLDTDGNMSKADATTAALANTLLAVSADDYTSGNDGLFYIFGVVGLSGFQPGRILYASTTPGLVQDDRPLGGGEIVRIVGYGLSGNQIFFNPDRTWIELEP